MNNDQSTGMSWLAVLFIIVFEGAFRVLHRVLDFLVDHRRQFFNEFHFTSFPAKRCIT